MWGETGLIMGNIYSVFTSEALQNLLLKVSNPFRNCLVAYLSSENVCSHPTGPSEKQKRLSLRKLSLLKARASILAYIEEKHAPPGFHVSFAEREEAAQLEGLFTRDRLREMLKDQ